MAIKTDATWNPQLNFVSGWLSLLVCYVDLINLLFFSFLSRSETVFLSLFAIRVSIILRIGIHLTRIFLNNSLFSERENAWQLSRCGRSKLWTMILSFFSLFRSKPITKCEKLVWMCQYTRWMNVYFWTIRLIIVSMRLTFKNFSYLIFGSQRWKQSAKLSSFVLCLLNLNRRGDEEPFNNHKNSI